MGLMYVFHVYFRDFYVGPHKFLLRPFKGDPANRVFYVVVHDLIYVHFYKHFYKQGCSDTKDFKLQLDENTL